MDWRGTILGVLVTSLFLVSVTATNLEYFDLSEYSEYCEEQNIEEYCAEKDFLNLVSDINLGRLDSIFVNELAYSEEVVHHGPLQITDVKVDITTDGALASVIAVYKLKNTGSEREEATIMAKRVPANIKVYEDGSEVTLDTLLYDWDSGFSAGQEKEIKLVFTEWSGEGIYGYNTNLVIDGKIPARQITPNGKFTMLLPEGTVPISCTPDESSRDVIDGRFRITWQKSNFAPWTNPFNDLICTWMEVDEDMMPEGTVQPEPVAPVEPKAVEQPQADNSWMLWILLFVLLAGVIYWYARVKR